jgi:hypothetical protein
MNIKGTQVDFDRPPIFIGKEAMSPMNIRGLYSSLMWLHGFFIPSHLDRAATSHLDRAATSHL